MLDERSIVIPIELTKTIYASWQAGPALADSPDKLYSKTLTGPAEVVF
jgi:hypothetical protein